MLNYILASLGLVKISRAKQLTMRLHEYYVRCIQEGVRQDFGAIPDIYALEESCKWWNIEFDAILASQCDDVKITSTPGIYSSRKVSFMKEHEANYGGSK